MMTIRKEKEKGALAAPMTKQKKQRITIAEENKRVSRSIKKTPNCKFDANHKPCCPNCETIPGDSIDYETGKNKGEVVFYYRCAICGQTFRRVVDIKDI